MLMVKVYINGKEYLCDSEEEHVMANKMIRYKCIAEDGSIKYLSKDKVKKYQEYTKPRACTRSECPYRLKKL